MFIAALLAAGLQTTHAQQNNAQGEKLLASAQHKATVDGDLQGAIEEYKKIVARAGANRTLAAQALFRMAECYQKLGDAESQKIYERIVREYADQRDPAAQARARLAVLQEQRTPLSPSGMVSRQVWTGPQVDILGSVSPDGRLLSFVDWETGDLALRNLATGDNRRLTNKGSWDQSAEFALFSRISPDGRLIAYNWMKKNFGWEIRVGPVDGSSYRALFSTDANDDYAHAEAWSPDGKQLAVLLAKDVNKIGLIAVADGSPRVLKSFDWRSPRKHALLARRQVHRL
ncbi:MAG: tetratricopeptide repeat protein [Acidobacteria bacterium]|nr:tetratricopeptide repeat protein [Acidobacteriota bacterium]